MSYFRALGLSREPFSTSPDPDFFYLSLNHHTCLKRLEISVRLRRGLSVVFGDVGVGKTTLSRTLLKTFQDEENFIFRLILDPGFESEHQFLESLARLFAIAPVSNSTSDFKEALEKYLFQKGVEENKTVILLIDEGQKLSGENLEVLRTLLNFETNEYKLLQLVILAQSELFERIRRINNFIDRAALKYSLGPLDERESVEMIEFRLEQAGCAKYNGLFTPEALRLIHGYTQGYPRKISMLCHDALERLVMRDASNVDAEIINDLIGARDRYEGCCIA